MLLMILFVMSASWVIYSYLVYPGVLLFLDLIFPPETYQTSDNEPFISIVIAAYNEEQVIKSRIENCLSIDYPRQKLEIIIASDGSSDQTNEIVRQYQDQGVTLMEYSQRRGKVNVLNETVPKCQGEIVVFSDANTHFKRDAIKKLVPVFADERVGCVCGGLMFVSADGSYTGELEGIYWRYETFLKKLEGKRGALLGANGAIFGVRKELYYPCPADTIVEDFMMPMKILQNGYHVVYQPNASAIEEAAHKIVQEKERRIRIGAGDFQALLRLMPLLNPLRGFPALAFWSHKVMRWFAPFFLIIAFIANLMLSFEHNFYFITMMIQVSFYGSALIGQLLSKLGRQNKFFQICYYFVSMNLALLLGFFRFIGNTQHVTWRRTERA